MALKTERPDVLERLGRALNSGSLVERGLVVETAVLQVGALGAAGLHIHHGADRLGQPVAAVVASPTHRPDPQDVLAAQLGSLLAHIRYARQHESVPRAVAIFAEWMRYRGRFSGVTDVAELLPRLAERSLHEWLSDRCPRCCGTGRLEQSPTGQLVRGGRMVRNAIFRPCPVHDGCGGTGRPTPSHTARRIALGLSLERYEAENWGGHVRAAISWLDRMQRRTKKPLTVQLERSKNRV